MSWPRRAAASRMRNAVVRFADSYGASISAKVRVFLGILASSVPECFVTGLEMVDDDVDRGSRDPLGQLRDAALLKREVIRENLDPAAPECRQGGGMGRRPRRQHTVLNQQKSHVVAGFDETLRQFIEVG